jgi:hypothetical protein
VAGRLRRLGRAARRVVTDVGQHDGVPIDLEREAGGGYAFRLGVRAGFGGQDAARVAITQRVNPDPHPILKEIHACEVAGRRLEAANVHALRAKVAALLESIAPARALPLCFFRAPAMDYELPAYESRGELTSPVLGGPALHARDLAELRRNVCRYLVAAGYVAEPDEVLVGVLRPRDLRRVPPAAVFRSLDDPDEWLPSVEGVSDDGPVVGVLGEPTLLGGEERPRPAAGPGPPPRAPAAPDVVELLRFLRTARGRARGRDLYASEVRPEIWAAAERRLEPTGRHVAAYLADDAGSELELPVLRTGFGELVVALHDRGICVFLAATEAALAAAVGRYLAATGFLPVAAEVELRDAAPPRPERLDPAAIASHPPSGGADSSWP